MKTSLVAAALLGLVLLVPPPPAQADGSCPAACGAAKRTCVMAAVTAFRTCRGDARATGATGPERRDALRSCRDTFRTAGQTCGTALHDCLGACQVPPPVGSCRGDCNDQGRACVAGVVATAKTCVQTCALGRGRGQCLFACGRDAKTGLEDCRSALQSCRDACDASPSGAFLD